MSLVSFVKEPGEKLFSRGKAQAAMTEATSDPAHKYMAIFEANRPMLQHPDKIYPGQVLRIPPQ